MAWLSFLQIIIFVSLTKLYIFYYFWTNGIPIPSSDHYRNLGVIFSSKPSWSKHCSVITGKATKINTVYIHTCTYVLSFITPVRMKVFQYVRMYISLVGSQLTNYSEVWWPHLIKDIKTQTANISASFKFLPLMHDLQLQDVIFLIKCLKFPDPSSPVLDFFSISSTRSSTLTKFWSTNLNQLLTHHSTCTWVRIWNIHTYVRWSFLLKGTSLGPCMESVLIREVSSFQREKCTEGSLLTRDLADVSLLERCPLWGVPLYSPLVDLFIFSYPSLL